MTDPYYQLNAPVCCIDSEILKFTDVSHLAYICVCVCFFSRNPEPDFIRTGVWIGAYELHKGAERYRTIVYPVYPTYHHYHDTGRGYENDIVLLKLTKKVEFTDNIAPINLPADKSPIESFSECWITGWGQVGNGGMSSTLSSLKNDTHCMKENTHIYWKMSNTDNKSVGSWYVTAFYF